jgi:hypothetical protein
MALLLYFAVAVAVSALVDRWVAKLPVGCAASLLLLPLLFASGPLARGEVLVPADIGFSFFPHRAAWDAHGVESISAPNFSDVAVQLIPWQEAVRFALRNGEPPLFNPFIGAGDVLGASMQPAWAYPLNVLGLLLPLADATSFVLLVTFFVAGLGMFLLLRDLGLRPEAAFFGAAAFELSKYVFFWSHWNVGYAASLAPAILLVARRMAVRASPRSFGASSRRRTARACSRTPDPAGRRSCPAPSAGVDRPPRGSPR